MMRAVRPMVRPLVTAAVLIAAWQALVWATGVPRFILPDPARVAVVGFSAGGHVAARLATRSALRVYEAVDTADRLSARPAAAGVAP